MNGVALVMMDVGIVQYNVVILQFLAHSRLPLLQV
jgi:hypothetical protein